MVSSNDVTITGEVTVEGRENGEVWVTGVDGTTGASYGHFIRAEAVSALRAHFAAETATALRALHGASGVIKQVRAWRNYYLVKPTDPEWDRQATWDVEKLDAILAAYPETRAAEWMPEDVQKLVEDLKRKRDDLAYDHPHEEESETMALLREAAAALSNPPTRRRGPSMARADLEAAAEEKYPKNIVLIGVFGEEHDDAAAERAAYIRGRLDQAEADAQIAETSARGYDVSDWDDVDEAACNRIATEIQKGVQ